MTAQTPTPPRGTPRMMLTAEQAAECLGIGRTTMYALLKSGEITSVLIGRLRRIPAEQVRVYSDRLMAEQNPTTEGN